MLAPVPHIPQAGIHDGTTAKLALQPLVNLARPQIREGDPMRPASSMPRSWRLLVKRRRNMAISNRDILSALASYLELYPEEAALLSEPVRLLSQGGDLASRQSFPVHATAGALLVRSTVALFASTHEQSQPRLTAT